MCLDPEDPACKGIVEKANRAIDPSKARNNKDRKHRLRKRQQIISELMPEADIPTLHEKPHNVRILATSKHPESHIRQRSMATEHAAVDHHFRAGNVGTGAGAQEDAHAGNILGRTQPG